MEASDLLVNWPIFSHDIVQRFNPVLYDILGRWLSKLVQTSTVEEFQNRYEAQANRVIGIRPWLLKEMFISCLKPEIQHEVLRTKPNTIQEAFSEAKLIERQYNSEHYTLKGVILGSKKNYNFNQVSLKSTQPKEENNTKEPQKVPKQLLQNFKRSSLA